MTRASAARKTRFAFSSPNAALRALLDRLRPVEAELTAWSEAPGRIVAQPLLADRDSPACDVSAMDGYAVRLAEIERGPLAVAAEAKPGAAAPALPRGQAVRIFTGAAVPGDAEAVVRREDVEERPDRIRLRADVRVRLGDNIRRRGENARQGEPMVAAGAWVTPAVMTAIASFGAVRPKLFRKVRVALITTGDELREVDGPVEPWELRDSNGPALEALLAGRPWLTRVHSLRVKDDLSAIRDALRRCLGDCDAVFLTGGVSMGDHDHVPDAVHEVGAEPVFHKLPIRPGKPLLAAVGREGQPILGLPGNPVSVMVTARRFGLAALRRLAGMAEPIPPSPLVEVSDPGEQRLCFWWYRPVQLREDGSACFVSNQGSGDVAAAARSDGFVEIAPDRSSAGRWPFYPWR